jgi:hypothetical protein
MVADSKVGFSAPAQAAGQLGFRDTLQAFMRANGGALSAK